MSEHALMAEGKVMYDVIKDIDTPKEVLTKLAGLKPVMGFNIHPERVRALAYAIWLKEKKFDDILDYYEKMLEFFSKINVGGTIDLAVLGNLPEAPEGWITPMPYLKGEIPKEGEKLVAVIVHTKTVVCDACEKEITDDVTECPLCGATLCPGCEVFVDESEMGKGEEYCNDCLVSAAESRREAMYDMD